MSKSNFLVSCAKSIFALATVAMMSMAFSACSSDNKDEDPQLKKNVLTINDREVPVQKVVCSSGEDGIYKIRVFFDENQREELCFMLNEQAFFNKVIDLSKKGDEPPYWEVMYEDEDGDGQMEIDTWSKPDSEYGAGEAIFPVFQNGSLFVSRKSENSIYIKLKGKVIGADGSTMYDLAFLYEGVMEVKTE
ncbi:MAG: hypothetical protein D8H98_00700 [Prevotella sp.]|nr:MAG: hypothetical protein D8H98_00700 [Prevotella sp.]